MLFLNKLKQRLFKRLCTFPQSSRHFCLPLHLLPSPSYNLCTFSNKLLVIGGFLTVAHYTWFLSMTQNPQVYHKATTLSYAKGHNFKTRNITTKKEREREREMKKHMAIGYLYHLGSLVSELKKFHKCPLENMTPLQYHLQFLPIDFIIS